MTPKESAHQKISELVQRFNEQFDSYKRAEYNETLTRRDFIDPFFKALGWDIDNEQGYAEAYREVIHEDKVKVGSATKAPDYSFRLSGGKRLFFVEAKKPSIDIKEGVQSAYQVRRYGWSAKLSICVITDFEEFSIYDCTIKPKPDDKASVARIRYIHYNDYLKEFDFIWDTFSKEQVLKGSFDKFLQGSANKKGTATVDKDFLQSLDNWRSQLASSISRNNHQLDEDELNFAVQQTIDRIIFLRIAEDRGIEPYGNLQKTLQNDNYYQNLFEQFQLADDKYNSGLFDFKKDKICASIVIENKVVKSIINELYYPVSPYEFSVLSVEILGSAYEQFLGKVIRVTPAHFTKIEEKPEVRKAGGVYYTPQYIVDYIVQNTVGKLIEDKTPAQVSEIKICDPACGSGSFLIGAFQYLLDWHKNYYNNDSKSTKGKKDSPLTPEGYLTTSEKKRILLNNIYGVDIDVNAVEVTKLSLLLKCLEGETSASIAYQFSMFNERVLPTLDNNIKDGNSLIDLDFYANQMDFGFEKKIKPFNWQKAFPAVFNRRTETIKEDLKTLAQKAKSHAEKALEYVSEIEERLNQINEPLVNFENKGGFDCVIGNPPWGAELNDEMKKYLVKNYPLVPTKTKDTYFYFLFRAINLSRENGIIGLILPNTWLLINNANEIRGYLLKKQLAEIIDYGDNVFADAIVEASSIIFNNQDDGCGDCSVKRYRKGKLLIDNKINKALWQADLLNRFNIDINNDFDSILKKANKLSEPFANCCDIIFGIKPYQLGHGKPSQTKETISNRIFHSEKQYDSSWKPLVTGTDIKRYSITFPGNQYIKYGEWLMYKSNENKILGQKILLRRTSDNIRACFDDKQYYPQNSIFIITSQKINLYFLLGILNSLFFNYIYRKKCPQVGKIFAEVKPSIIKELPVRVIKDGEDLLSEMQNDIISLVNQLLQLNQDKQNCKLETRLNQIQSKIDYCEDRINAIVYQLYGLTEEEIKIVEGK